jgi:predicted DNA-binding protein YlxM (UPF0122 family)/DNA-directed RNA polymerase specialized sigma24 family protein
MVAPLPADVVERLQQMYVDGATHDEICRTLGIGRTTLKRYLKKLRLPARATPIVLTPEDLAKLKLLYADHGLTNDEIASALGFSRSTLDAYVSRYGLPRRGRGYAKVRSTPDAVKRAEVRALFLATPPIPLRLIAERAQLSMYRVRRIAFEEGLSCTARRGRTMSADEQATFRRLRVAGYSLATIAAEMKISEGHATRLAMGLDAPRPVFKRILSADEKDTLKDLYCSGVPLNEIVQQLNVFKARIHREIAAMGIERRNERRPEKVLSAEHTATLMDLYYNTDTSVRAICDEFELQQSSFYRIIDRNGGGRRTTATGMAHRLSEMQRERIRSLYRDPDRTIPEICSLASISEDTLYRVLALLGEPRRMEPTKVKMHDPTCLAELQRRYLDTTISVEQIRDELGLTKKTFNKLVRSLGLRPRSASNRKPRG